MSFRCIIEQFYCSRGFHCLRGVQVIFATFMSIHWNVVSVSILSKAAEFYSGCVVQDFSCCQTHSAACPVKELCPFPRFCQPMSNKHGTETKSSSLSSAVLVIIPVLFEFVASLRLFLVIFSTAFPTSFSLCLNVFEFIAGMLMQDKIVFIWVWPIPAWREPIAILACWYQMLLCLTCQLSVEVSAKWAFYIEATC